MMINWKTLDTVLAAAGMEDLGTYPCENCKRMTKSSSLADVREVDELPGRFVCRICTSDMDRQAKAEAKAALPWPTEEQLNDLRAQRDIRLIKTDHTQLLDYRSNMTEEQLIAIDAYRAEVRNVVKQAKEGIKIDFPDLPTEE